ncbi:PBECR2 nuclease fold domain-containing protein [Zoogloea sp.]|uniref:PBECR2 nuclease fold domain-containing protein n=1 Tax=Zoogloea sp. TaxID=49181 RepID=UPI002623CA12|nr:PBECR2 nuclease fold domain-containing protein [Zoogloea sp.]
MPASPAQLPFREAIDFYRGKLKLPSAGWTDIWQQQHSQAFVIAGASHDALVEDFYNAVRKAQEEGTGYEAFRKDFDTITAKHGWAHTGTPGWRSKIIYDTNITQAYNAGRYQQMQAVKHLRPYWEYRHTPGEHPRLTHLAWDGLILPADDPWWSTHFPQNGWGCKCRVNSLSRVEASRKWDAAGKAGPDQAPEIEWEEKTVGKNGSQPRTVRVPKGIDPGFAYNPGQAWLEPHTVPPLTGYQAVLAERGAAPLPMRLPAPKPTPVPGSALLPASTAPERAVSDFLDVFGATMAQGAVFEDATGAAVAITKALFDDGGKGFGWMAGAGMVENINLLAMTLIEPDEVWWHWERDTGEAGRWRLKRRYLRAFQVEGEEQTGVVAFEWGRTGWRGKRATMAAGTEAEREALVNKYRIGRLVHSTAGD